MARCYAPAKVNLFLHVGSVRADRRHPLDSLVVFSGDEAAVSLTLTPCDRDELVVSGPTATGAGPIGSNLVLRALQASLPHRVEKTEFHMALHKAIPAAAGLGGGSADAAALLRILVDIGELDRGKAREIAPRLGGDVLAAFENMPCLMRGDGDRVERVSGLPPVPAVLINAGIPCPTGLVFAAFDEVPDPPEFAEIDLPAFSSASDLIQWLASVTRNDLEAPAIALVPSIAESLRQLEDIAGAKLARMSGSGASCFALFATWGEAEAAAETLREDHPGWWAAATMLGQGA